MNRKTFGFKDTYEINAELKRGGWRAASMMAAESEESPRSQRRNSKEAGTLSDKAAKQLEQAEDYAQSLSKLSWESVTKVVSRIATLRDEVMELAELCQSTMTPADAQEGDGIVYASESGPLTIGDDEAGGRVLLLEKEESGTAVEVVTSEKDQTVKELLADGSSIMLSHADNILTEAFNDGCVSRLDRKQYLKTIQLSPSDGNILIQAVLHGPKRGHLTIQCMDGTCVIYDEEGTRTMRLASPRNRRRFSSGRSPQAKPPKGPPPSSPNRDRARTSSTDLSSAPPPPAPAGIARKGSLFRQLTAEKKVPTRIDQANEATEAQPEEGEEGKIMWRCIRRLWIHNKPATISALIRQMEIGETIVQTRRIHKTVGRTWIEFRDSRDPKNKDRPVRYVATTTKLGLKTIIPLFNS